jgi:hypothetical protein
MAIQVKQIIGNTIELFFNPHEDDLRVGENLWIGETQRRRGVIVQIIEFRTLPLPFLWQEGPSLTSAYRSASEPVFSGQEALRPGHEGHPAQVAIAKIRRLAEAGWHQWDGWIPGHNTVASRMTDEEVLRQCVSTAGNPLKLGRTLAGDPFSIEGSTLGQVNIVADGKETRAMQLAAVMLREFVDCGAPCVVFDSTGELSQRCRRELHVAPGKASFPHVIHLQAGQDFRLDLRQMGSDSLLTLLTEFGLPRLAAMSYASHPARVLEPLQHLEEASQSPAYVSLQSPAAGPTASQAAEHAMIHGAFLSCLKAIQGTGLLASHTSEATSLTDAYEKIRHGGALMLDISGLPNRARPGVVQACIEILQGLESAFAPASPCLPLLFFEQAHLYLDGPMLGDLVGRSRPSGMTMMLLTNTVDRLDDSILRQAENLFVCGPMSDEAVQHLSKTGLTDRESLHSLVQRLQDHQSLLVGTATKQYPMIFEVDSLAGGEVIEKPRRYFRPRRLQDSSPAALLAKDTTLPLFPEEESAPADPLPPSPPPSALETPSSLRPEISLTHMTAQWLYLVSRVARRRRILETILSTARPLQIREHTLVVGFPPQHRLQRELFDSPEYRGLLEEELTRVFGQTFAVETVLHQTSTGPQPRP